MYGLVSKAPKTEGMAIKKPWTLATNCPYIIYMLPKFCDGSHQHTRCEGTDTKLTEEYTDEMVAQIHRAWALQVFDDADYCQNTGGSNFLNKVSREKFDVDDIPWMRT